MNATYYNLENPASFSTAEKLHEALRRKIPLDAIKKWLSGQLAYTLHKPIRRKYPRNHYEVDNIFDQFQADLMDLSSLRDANDGHNFVLLVIDAFSRYVWARPLKRKSAPEVLSAFKSIIEEAGKAPRQLVTDRGKEFFNSQMSEFLKSKNIQHYAPSNDQFKASIAERAIRTYKSILYKILTAKLSHRWLEMLSKITKSINARYHRTIGCAPKDVNESNILRVWHHIRRVRMRDTKMPQKQVKSDITPGDYVRVAKNKDQMMDKGFLPGWTDEIFRVTRHVKRKPHIYNLEDESGEKIEGAFYRPEIQKVTRDDNTLYRINKILQRRTRRGIREVLVEWKGYKNKKNNCSWIPESNLIDNE